MTLPVKSSRVQTEAQVATKLEQLLKKREWTKLIYMMLDWNASLSYSADLATDATVVANKNRTFMHWQVGVPGDAAQMEAWVMTEAVTFPALFADNQVSIQTSATAETTYIIEKNGSGVGTIVIATDDSVTYTSTGSAAVAFAIGDVMTLEAPATDDVTLAGVAFSIMGAVA
jgi:phage-related protein